MQFRRSEPAPTVLIPRNTLGTPGGRRVLGPRSRPRVALERPNLSTSLRFVRSWFQKAGGRAMRLRTRPKARKGGSAVEMAIIAPVFVALILGQVETARLGMVSQLIT